MKLLVLHVSFRQNKQMPPVGGHTVTALGKEGLFTILYKDEMGPELYLTLLLYES